MLHDDRIVFALLLCRIYLRGQRLNQALALENGFQHLMRGDEDTTGNQSDGADSLREKFPNVFSNIKQKLSSNSVVREWLETPNPEDQVPALFDENVELCSELKLMYELLIVKTFRPDRMVAGAQRFVASILGSDFHSAADSELDFANIVENLIDYVM